MSNLKFRTISRLDKLDPDIVKHMRSVFALDITSWEKPKYYITVAYDNKDWVAYGCLSSYAIENNENICHLGPTFVKEEYRGKNIQVKLIKKRLRLAKKLGYTKAVSNTWYFNYYSNNNLIKCKFFLSKQWESHKEWMKDTLYWERVIK